MTIQTFISEQILIPRLKQTGVLVVYDPDRRYPDLCMSMGAETTDS